MYNNFKGSLIESHIRDLIMTPRPNLFKVLRELAQWRLPKSLTWTEVSEQLNYSEERLKELNPKISKIKILRAGTRITYPGKALGVSYTEYGLQFVCSNRGQLLYFKDAMFVAPDKDIRLQKGNVLERNPHTIVEDFVPRDHIFNFNGKSTLNRSWQNTEIMWVDKALRMLYVSQNYVDTTSQKTLVYSTENTDDKTSN